MLYFCKGGGIFYVEKINIVFLCMVMFFTFLLIPSFAVTVVNEPIIKMGDEILVANEKGICAYTTDSMENIPILYCEFDPLVYSALITQPSENNGYEGVVSLTDITNGDVKEYIIKVYLENTFYSHITNLGGDPWVTYHDGWYYYMYTGNGFSISRSRELDRIASNPKYVFNISDLGFDVKELWAPELHFIDGYWYIYFTAYDNSIPASATDSNGTAKNHRMYVLKSSTSDALGEYTFMGQIKEIESDYLGDSDYSLDYSAPGHYAIDQSIFKWQEKLYAIWSGWNGYKSIGQRIYIAEMSDPCTISGSRVELSRPELAYETYDLIPAVNEAPQALISPNGKTLNIAFSVNRFDNPHYSLGLLTLKKNGDPLNADDWTKTEKPVFETSAKNRTYSVGHCSFVPSPDGSEFFMVYHARRGEDIEKNPREVRVEQFYWNDDGTPYFGEAIGATDLVNS